MADKTSNELALEQLQQLLDSTTDVSVVKVLSGIINNVNDLSYQLKSKQDELDRTNKSYNELKDDYISSVKHGGFNNQAAKPLNDPVAPKDVSLEGMLADFLSKSDSNQD